MVLSGGESPRAKELAKQAGRAGLRLSCPSSSSGFSSAKPQC